MQRAYNDCGGKVKVRNSLKVQMRKNILKYSKMSKNIGNTKWNYRKVSQMFNSIFKSTYLACCIYVFMQLWVCRKLTIGGKSQGYFNSLKCIEIPANYLKCNCIGWILNFVGTHWRKQSAQQIG